MTYLETKAAHLHCNLLGLVRKKFKRRGKATMVNISAYLAPGFPTLPLPQDLLRQKLCRLGNLLTLSRASTGHPRNGVHQRNLNHD